MAIPTGRTLYKKKDGILTLTSDYQTVTWTPNSTGPATVSLPVANITSKHFIRHQWNNVQTTNIYVRPAADS